MKLVLIGDAVSGVQTVVDVLIPAEGMNVDQTFPPEVLGAAKQAPDEIDRGWLTKDGGRSFVAPPAPPPLAPESATQMTFMGFLSLFTQAEQAAIVSSDNVQIKLFCLMAAGANFVDLEDLRTIAGTKELETLGLIGKGRADQVLAGASPAAS
jgi:hypothetical protein